MKNIIFLLVFALILSIPLSAEAGRQDRTLGVSNDKWVHFGAGMAINAVLKDRKVPWIRLQDLLITSLKAELGAYLRKEEKADEQK